jgi:hypothetical protein
VALPSQLGALVGLHSDIGALASDWRTGTMDLKTDSDSLHRLGDRRSFDLVRILSAELAVVGCAGDADFARLCRNLPTYLVEIL